MGSIRRAARWLAGLEPGVVAVAAPLLMFPTLLPGWSAGALLALAVVWLLGWLGTGSPSPATALNGALLIFVLTLPLGVWASAYPEWTLPKLTGLILGLAAFRAVANGAPSRQAVGWAAGIYLALGLGLTLVGLAGAFWAWKVPALQPYVSRIPQLIRGLPGAEGGIHPNELGGTVTFFLPVSVVVTLMSSSRAAGRRWARRATGLLLTLFLTGVLLLTQSRSAWIGVLAGLAAMAAVRWRWARWQLVGLAVLLTLGFLYLGPEAAALTFLPEPVSATGEILLDGSSLAERLQPWQQGLDALTEYPLTGVGLGAFRAVAHRFGPWPRLNPDPENSHAHNIFLQTGLDLGIVGLVAYAALIGIALWICLALARRAQGAHRGLALGILGALVSFHVFGLADAIALGAKPGLALWMLLGLAAALWNTRHEPPVTEAGIGQTELGAT